MYAWFAIFIFQSLLLLVKTESPDKKIVRYVAFYGSAIIANVMIAAKIIITELIKHQ